MTDSTAIGQRVATAREHRGMTREALATRSGMSWSAITQIETGRRRNPRADTLAALARALRVPADYLLAADPFDHAVIGHYALLYNGPRDFTAKAGPFVAEGVASGEPTLVVSTSANRSALRRHLGAAAKSVEFADSGRWYRSPLTAFRGYRDYAARELHGGAAWLRILGEPKWSAEHPPEDWARYEALLDLAFAHLPVTIACPYDEASLAPEIVELARAAHGHADPAELCLRG